MKIKHVFTFVLLVHILLIYPDHPMAKWAHSFVVWDGYIYVLKENEIDNTDKKIGEVTSYSDVEGTYSGNFSNTYEKGTKYYSIKGMSTDEAIAVQVGEGTYLQAVREGKYEEEGFFSTLRGVSIILFGIMVGCLMIVPIIYMLNRRIWK